MNTDELIIKISSKFDTLKNDISSLVSRFEKFDKIVGEFKISMSNVGESVSNISKHFQKTTKDVEKFSETVDQKFKNIVKEKIELGSNIDTESLQNKIKKLEVEQSNYTRVMNRLKEYQAVSPNETRGVFNFKDIGQFTLNDLPKVEDKLKSIQEEIDTTRAKMKNPIGDASTWKSFIENANQAKYAVAALSDALKDGSLNDYKSQVISVMGALGKEYEFTQKELEAKRKNDEETEKTANNYKKLKKSINGTKSAFSSIKKGIKSASNSFSELRKNISKGVDKAVNKIKKLTLGLLGIRTVMSLLTKAVNAYLSFDSELQDSITNSWNMLGSLLAPAIEYVAQLFALATNYVYQFVQALTGVDLVARANAKALETQAKATQKANNAQRSLTSMDEITNLPTESSPTEASQISVDNINPDGIFSDLIDALKNQKWHLAGEIIAKGINDALGSINWSTIQSGAEKLGTGIASFLNGVFELNWTLLGTTLGNGIQTALNFAYGFVEEFEFGRIGQGIALGLNGAFKSIDWKQLAVTISDGLIGILHSITSFIVNADWEQIGEDIRTFLTNIKWGEIWEALKQAIASAFTGFGDFLSGLFNIDDGGKLAGTILVIGGLAVVFKKLHDAMKDIKKDKGDITEGINTMASGFGNMMESLGKAAEIIALLGGIALVLTSVSDLVKTLSSDSVNLGAVIGVLATVFAGIAVTMALLAALGPALSEAMVPFVVVVAGLSAILIVVAATLPTILSAIGEFVNTLAPAVVDIVTVINDLFQTVGEVIVNILKTVAKTVDSLLTSIINFINRLGPAINNFINNVIKGVTKLINFMISAMEFMINSTVIKGLKGLIKAANKIPGVSIDTPKNVTFDRFAPKLATGTNYIEQEGIYHLHEGEEVVPKKYNPSADGYDNKQDNKEMIDLLVSLNSSFLQYANRPMNISMNSKKVAEAIYDDTQTITKNKNKSNVVVRS